MSAELPQLGHLARALVEALGPDGAHRAVDALAQKFTTLELAALAAEWSCWALPLQLPPPGDWRSWTRFGGRGMGKTLGMAHFVNGEVEAGRAPLVGLSAQTEDLTIGLQVTGPSGLIATAPPWFKPRYRASLKVLEWPNGARAFIRTPEAAANIRGIDYHLSWLSEVQDWPRATALEAFSNFDLTTRVGYARTVIDGTQNYLRPLCREIEKRAAENPTRHIITRGRSMDNPFLRPDVLEDWTRQFGLTTIRGRQELLGEVVDDAESMFRAEWFETTRRHLPDAFTRRVVACDPAITSDRRYSDRSGIVDAGVGADGQLYVARNLTAKHRAEDLGAVLVAAYIEHDCCLLIIETNRGGNTHTALVRMAAKARGHDVVVLGADEKPQARPGTIYIREVNNRGKKLQRLEVLAALMEKRAVSFVIGGTGLEELEEQLLVTSAIERGPDDGPDALAMAAVELSDATRTDALAVVRGQLDGLAARTRQALRPGATYAMKHREPLIRDLADRRLATRRAPRKMW